MTFTISLAFSSFLLFIDFQQCNFFLKGDWVRGCGGETRVREDYSLTPSEEEGGKGFIFYWTNRKRSERCPFLGRERGTERDVFFFFNMDVDFEALGFISVLLLLNALYLLFFTFLRIYFLLNMTEMHLKFP